jgi:hypothetical protein
MFWLKIPFSGDIADAKIGKKIVGCFCLLPNPTTKNRQLNE